MMWGQDRARLFSGSMATRCVSFEVAYSAIFPKGFQRLAGGKLAPPPESKQKYSISRRDDSDRVFCRPFGTSIIGESITGRIRCARPRANGSIASGMKNTACGKRKSDKTKPAKACFAEIDVFENRDACARPFKDLKPGGKEPDQNRDV